MRNERRYDQPYRPPRNRRSTQKPDFVYASQAIIDDEFITFSAHAIVVVCENARSK